MKGTRRRKLKDGLKFEQIKSDTVFGPNEAQKLADKSAKHTLKGIEVNVILAISQEYGMQIMKVLGPKFGTSG